MSDKLMNIEQFKTYVEALKVKRKITIIQLHHTYSPSYSNFNGQNHLELQKGMREYHMRSRNYNDIAQTFTIFPDGLICTGRDINNAPAGIYGANSEGICIECLGNFDGVDEMTSSQKDAIVATTKILLDKFKLNAKENVTYHAWWSADGKEIGDYIKGASVKTCPGVNFFGGNTLSAYRDNLQPLIENYGKVKLESGNDIVWELINGKHKIEITEIQRAIKALEDAKNDPKYNSLYWIIYKFVNK